LKGMAAVWMRVSNIGDISEVHYTLDLAASPLAGCI